MKNNNGRIGVRIDPDLKTELQIQCLREKKTLSEKIQEMIESLLGKK